MKLWRLTWVRDHHRELHDHPKVYEDPGNVKRAIAFHQHLNPSLQYKLEESDVHWREVVVTEIKL